MTDPHALPKYIRIAEMLVREVAAGRLVDGARLPPERDMADELGLSVGTLRKALAELEGKGLLERVQGSGNYIRNRPDISGVYGFFRLELEGGGGLPTAEVLSVDRLPKPAGAPEFGPSDRAHRIRRLRWLGDHPAAIEEIWLDGSRAEMIRQGDLSESLYLYYRAALGLWISRVEDRVWVERVPDWSPEAFTPRPGTPAGYVERVAQDQQAVPVEFSRTWFDAERVRFVARQR